jgi:branched-chain amino acid transport system permease protein
VGATVFTLLEDQIARFDYWRLILGMVILGLVVLAPEGLAGTGARIARSLKPEAA